MLRSMRIGIIGGTGNEGRGIALRWARAGHDVFIGSRDAERGKAKAEELSSAGDASLRGGSNEDCCKESEVVLLSVPYSAHRATLEGLKEALQGKVMIDITVPLQPPKVRVVNLPEGGAAALEARELLGEGVRVVAALHHVSAVHLGDPDHAIACDVLVCGEKDARESVLPLIEQLGVRALDAGPLKNAIALESLTPVLLHMNKRYGGNAGITFTNLGPRAPTQV